MNYIPSVVQTVAGDDFTVYVYFNDGSIHLADMKPLIAEGGVFAKLADEVFFRERLTVMNDTVAWDISGTRDETQCIDLDPCRLYEYPIVGDPLKDAV